MTYFILVFLTLLTVFIIAALLFLKKIKPLIWLLVSFVFVVWATISSFSIVYTIFLYHMGEAERFYYKGEYEKQLGSAKKALKYAITDGHKKGVYHWQNVAIFKLKEK